MFNKAGQMSPVQMSPVQILPGQHTASEPTEYPTLIVDIVTGSLNLTVSERARFSLGLSLFDCSSPC